MTDLVEQTRQSSLWHDMGIDSAVFMISMANCPFTHLHAFSWNLTDLALFALEDRQGLPCLAGLLNTNFQLFYHCLAGSCMLCCGPKVKTPLCVCCVVSRVWRAGVRFNRAGLWWGNLQIMVTAGGWETVGLSQGQSCLAQVGELGKVPNTN